VLINGLQSNQLKNLTKLVCFTVTLLTSLAVRAEPVLRNQNASNQTLEIPQTSKQSGQHSLGAVAPKSQVVEIPQRFLGCWRGEVHTENLLGIEMLSPPPISGWLTKIYKVCFVREADNTLKVTLVDSSVAPHEQVLRSSSTLKPVGAGDNRVELVGWLTMVERTASLFSLAPGPIAVVREHVKLDGRLLGKNTMEVAGEVEGYYNGHPWWIGHWICNFQHEP